TLTKPAAVLFTLSARSLNDVRDAMARGPLEVIAFSQDNRRIQGKGTLLLIDNMVDQASATMRMKAMLANEDEQPWPGDFVNAKAGFKRDAADKAARAEAEGVIQRWNDQLALGRDKLWSPTIRAGLLRRHAMAPRVLPRAARQAAPSISAPSIAIRSPRSARWC